LSFQASPEYSWAETTVGSILAPRAWNKLACFRTPEPQNLVKVGGESLGIWSGGFGTSSPTSKRDSFLRNFFSNFERSIQKICSSSSRSVGLNLGSSSRPTWPFGDAVGGVQKVDHLCPYRPSGGGFKPTAALRLGFSCSTYFAWV
jgi:hypothetical protein